MIIDVIYLVLLAMALFKGYNKGLIVAVFSLAAFVVGLAAALKLSWWVSDYCQNSLHMAGKWLPFVSFLIVFVGVALLIKWLAGLLKQTAKIAMLGWVDAVGGILLYAIIYTIVYSVVLYYATKLQVITPVLAGESKAYGFVVPWGPTVLNGMGKLLPVFSNLFSDLTGFFDTMANKAK